jgi:hypothetical protein
VAHAMSELLAGCQMEACHSFVTCALACVWCVWVLILLARLMTASCRQMLWPKPCRGFSRMGVCQVGGSTCHMYISLCIVCVRPQHVCHATRKACACAFAQRVSMPSLCLCS